MSNEIIALIRVNNEKKMNQVYCCIYFLSKHNYFHIMLILIKLLEILYNFRREKQVTRYLSYVNLTVVEDLKLKLNIQYPDIEKQTCPQKGIFNWISSLCSRLIRSPVDWLIAFILVYMFPVIRPISFSLTTFKLTSQIHPDNIFWFLSLSLCYL